MAVDDIGAKPVLAIGLIASPFTGSSNVAYLAIGMQLSPFSHVYARLYQSSKWKAFIGSQCPS